MNSKENLKKDTKDEKSKLLTKSSKRNKAKIFLFYLITYSCMNFCCLELVSFSLHQCTAHWFDQYVGREQ